MKAHTNDFKNEIKRFGRELDSKITYGTTELGKEQLNSVTPHYESSLLKSVMKQLDIDSNVEIPLETIINYQFGVKVGDSYEYLNYGNYVVYNVEKQEDTRSWKITCYDKMLYAMKDYDTPKVLTEDTSFQENKKYYKKVNGIMTLYEDVRTGNPSELELYENITYPITIKIYLTALCNNINSILANDDFVNADKEILSELYLDSEGNSLGYTYRDVLDEIAQVVAGIICINNDDELEVRYPQNTGEYETVEGTNLHLDNVDDTDDFSYELEGNTVQDGTPAPESPIEVQTVTGRQIITVFSNNNLFDTETITRNYRIDVNGNDYSASGYFASDFIEVDEETEYIKNSPLEDGYHRVCFYSSNDVNTFLSYSNNNEFTTPTGCNYLRFCGKLTELNTTMLFKRSDILYQEINLGKNLFDKSNATYKNGYMKDANGNEITTNASSYTTSYVSVLPNTTYTLSGSIAGSSVGGRVYYYDTNKNWISRSEGFGPNVNVKTFTTPANCYYLQVQFVTSVFDENVLQIERGNTKTDYSSYKTPIELCKIGDYKDKIYNQNNKWYLEKNIGKVIFNGTENWADRPNYTYADRFVLSNGVPSQKTNNFNGYSNYFIVANQGTIPDTYPYIRPNNTQATCNFSVKGTTTLEQFKTWLSTHNTILYYILATPTTTEITDTELINQLEAIRLKLGVNNITVESNNLSSPLKLTYLSELETIDEEMLKDVNVNFGEKFGPVNSVVLSRSAESDNIYIKDDESIEENGLTEIKIKDNQILNGNNRDEFINGIFDKLKGLEYYINDYVSTGIAYLELGDFYKVKVEDNYYKCLMLNDELDVTQGLEEPIHTEIMETGETDYTKSDKTDRGINQTYLIVDKQNGEINSVVQNVNTLQTVVNSQGEQIDSLGTRITQNIDSITASVSSIQSELDNGVSLVKTTSVIVNDEGLTVATDTSKTQTIMTSDKFIVRSGGKDLAYFGYDDEIGSTKAQMDNLTVTNYFVAGYHRTEKMEENGEHRTGVFYIGG